MTSHDPASLASSPWSAIPTKDLEAPATVPTMLSDDERRLYYWLARHWATGSGAIVDLGCFAGGSTALLAEGTRRAGREQSLWAYDRFHADEASKDKFLYAAGIPAFDGSDILPLAHILLEPWQPGITLIKGRIEEQRWNEGPIEILCVDAAKSVGVLDSLAATFYPALVPGQSLVVHQDFFHRKTPWIAAQMERMGEWFEPVAYCAPDTMVFLCRREVTHDALAAGRLSALPDTALIEAIEASRDWLLPWKISHRTKRLTDALRASPGARAAKDIR